MYFQLKKTPYLALSKYVFVEKTPFLGLCNVGICSSFTKMEEHKQKLKYLSFLHNKKRNIFHYHIISLTSSYIYLLQCIFSGGYKKHFNLDGEIKNFV